MRTDYLLEDEEVEFINDCMEFYLSNQSFLKEDWYETLKMIEKITQEFS